MRILSVSMSAVLLAISVLACGGPSSIESETSPDSEAIRNASLQKLENVISGPRSMDYELDQGDGTTPFDKLNLRRNHTFTATLSSNEEVSGTWKLAPGRNGAGEKIVLLQLKGDGLRPEDTDGLIIHVNPDGTYSLMWAVFPTLTTGYFAKTPELAAKYVSACPGVVCPGATNVRCVQDDGKAVSSPFTLKKPLAVCLTDDNDGTPSGFLKVVKQNFIDPNPATHKEVKYKTKADASLPIPEAARLAYNSALDAFLAANGPDGLNAPSLYSFVAAGKTIYVVHSYTAAGNRLISRDSTLFDAAGEPLTSVIDYFDEANSPNHQRFTWSN